MGLAVDVVGVVVVVVHACCSGCSGCREEPRCEGGWLEWRRNGGRDGVRGRDSGGRRDGGAVMMVRHQALDAETNASCLKESCIMEEYFIY